MAAMRALSNDATSAALRAHARRRSNLLGARTSVVAALSLLGCGAFVAAWLYTQAPVALFGATFFGVLGTGCLFKSLAHKVQSLRLRPRE